MTNDITRDYFVPIHEFISLEDNTLLTTPFVIFEFKEAIFSINPDKCPGPDGLNPDFF